MRKLIAAFLVLLLLTSGCALAELRRGDRGDEVIELQQMLFEAGFLFELPDGAFGKNTEDALKWFQEYANLEATGVASDAELDALRACLAELRGEPETVSEPEGDAPICCQRYQTEDGDEHLELCGRHAQIDKDEAFPAREKWENELNALYEAWLAASPEEGRAAILSSRSFFLLWLEQQVQALQTQGAVDAEARIAEMLRAQCAEICSLLPTESHPLTSINEERNVP